jgi:carboxypeptidase C (cathepsin A)
MKLRPWALLLAAAALSAPSLGGALAAPAKAGSAKAEVSTPADVEQNKGGSDRGAASLDEDAQPRERSIPFRGSTLKYTVTPGHLILRNDAGEPIASMFYTAYTVERGKGEPPRPVTFLFNGGPGSASMFLHLGSYGPLKLDLSKVQVAKGSNYVLQPNPNTLLDKTDLVFLDAITTGLSRPVGKGHDKDFWGVDQDIDAFARGIQRYIQVYNRWQSPKFLLGESYGTMRAGGLVYALQERGVQMTGVTVMSTVFSYAPAMDPGTDQIYVSYLPSYAMVAAYHKKLADNPTDPAAMSALAQKARDFANGPYLVALQKGNDLSQEERVAMAKQLSAFTGLSEQFLMENDLRVDPSRFRKELLRTSRRTIGRLDARFTAIDDDAAGDTPEYDAADVAFNGAFIANINDYLFRDLGYKTDLAYRPSSGFMIKDQWDFRHKPPTGRLNMAASTMPDLARALRKNPHLKLIDLNGYYDLATPFGGAEYDLKRIILDDSIKNNISYRYYASGHMIYINPDAANQIKVDLDAFYASAIAN